MQYILSLLPLLACPLGMELMMWMMMRGNKGQASQGTDQIGTDVRNTPAQMPDGVPQRSPVFSLFGVCLDWKVLVGLAVVGLAVWVVAPRFLLAAILLLLVAACPLSMLFMMRTMRGGGSQSSAVCTQPTREGLLATLKDQREALSAQIEEMEHPEIPAFSEAQSVAHSADEREHTRSGKRNS